GFSNLSAFSWSSYAGCMALWFSTEILLSFSSHRMVAILYGAIGAIGLLALRPVLQFLGHDIEQRIPSMAERLRAGKKRITTSPQKIMHQALLHITNVSKTYPSGSS